MSRRHKSTSTIPTMQILAVVVVMLAVLVGLAYMLAPRKPPAPAVSKLTYTDAPKPGRHRDDGASDNDASRMEARRTRRDAPPDAPPKEEEKNYSVLCTVVDVHTGKPILGAQVVARRKASDQETAEYQKQHQAIILARDASGFDKLRDMDLRIHAHDQQSADENGEAQVKFAVGGLYEINAVKPGYIEASPLTIVLTEDNKTDKLQFALSEGATASGRVVEAGTNQPAAGIGVYVERTDTPRTSDPSWFVMAYGREMAKTDEDGNYKVGGMVPGEYGITLQLQNTPYRPGAVLPYQKIAIANPTQELRGINFTVDPAGVVWGYVVSPQQEPIKGADVLLCTSASALSQALTSLVKRTPPLSARSRDDGYYELVGVPLNEEWRIYATSDNHSPQLADPFLLTAAKRNARMDIYLFAGTSVYGRVVDDKGKGVPGAQVLCIPAYSKLLAPTDTPPAFREARSDDNGDFVVKELPGGQYQIFAMKKGYKFAAMGEPIYPNGYSDITNLRLILNSVDEGAHSIYGTVADGAGNPIDAAQVHVEGLGMENFGDINRDTQSNGDGTFRFDGVEMGVYQLTVTKDGYSRRVLHRVLLDRENAVVLETSAVIRGHVVVGDTNRPPDGGYTVAAVPMGADGTVSRFAIMDTDTGGAGGQSFNNPDGSFEIYVAGGAYRVEANASGYTPARAAVTAESGQIADNVVLKLSKQGGVIAGKVVVSGSSTSPQGTEVTVTEAATRTEAAMAGAMGGSGQQSMQVGQDGAFRFENLPEGAYSLVAHHSGYADVTSDPVYLQAMGEIDTVLLTLSSGGGVEGYVRDGNGAPVTGAIVAATGGGMPQTSTTDSSGKYYIEGLSAGVYQVMVTNPNDIGLGNINIQAAQVNIQDGQIITHDFPESGGITIDGHCIPGPSTIGFAVLRAPGAAAVAIGQMVPQEQIHAGGVVSTSISMTGQFKLDGVQPGQWQIDIYYLQLGLGMQPGGRYVGSQPVQVTGEQRTIPLDITVAF